MATGIISIAAAADGQRFLSLVLFALAAGLYVVLGGRAVGSTRVSIDSFAVVAATSVLGARLATGGGNVAALVFATIAAVLWAGVWVRTATLGPVTAARLLAVVATQSLAIVAVLASATLAWPAVVLFTLGLILYLALIARWPPSQLQHGTGEIWIVMGALAISALAAADLSTVLDSTLLRAVDLIAWAAATCWIPVLAFAELRWPRTRYEPKRWSTVFPLGMYSTCTNATAHAARLAVLLPVSYAFLWIALTAWLVVAVGATKNLLGSRP